MRLLAALALVVAAVLIWPTSGSAITFGEWAASRGYSPGDVMPWIVWQTGGNIDDLDGIGEFDWISRPTTVLDLGGNQISSIESGDFDGLTNLRTLYLSGNPLTSVDAGDFDELTNLHTRCIFPTTS